MKKLSKILLLFSLPSIFFFACSKKEKYDSHIFGRWKISEYYLNNQSSYDTIVKYLAGYEYQFSKASHPQYNDVNATVHTYYQGEFAYFELKTLSNYGISIYFKTLVPAPPCQPLQVANGDTIRGCFECVAIWDLSFDGNERMIWDAKNTPNSPIQDSHKLIFTKID